MKMEITLRKDKEWKLIDGKLCLVKEFTPIGSNVIDGKVISPNTNVPYGEVILKCMEFESEIKGFITHKIDFLNLWTVYKERGIKIGEEVLIYWTVNHYKGKLSKLLSMMSPKIVVMVCPIGTYNSCPDGFKLENNRELLVNVYGLNSIVWFIPDVME